MPKAADVDAVDVGAAVKEAPDVAERAVLAAEEDLVANKVVPVAQENLVANEEDLMAPMEVANLVEIKAMEMAMDQPAQMTMNSNCMQTFLTMKISSGLFSASPTFFTCDI